MVNIGVTQGNVLASSLSNLFLLAETIFTTNGHSWHNTETDGGAGVKLTYRCDGDAFRLQRLEAREFVSHM